MLNQWPTSNQERELLATARFTDTPKASDIRTDNVGSFAEWDTANRAESMLDLTGLTDLEILEVTVWYATVLTEFNGTL